MRVTIQVILALALCVVESTTWARFVSVDPVQANPYTGGNFNRYYYGNNNPYRFTDPDGRCPAESRASACIETDRGAKSSSENVKLSSVNETFSTSASTRQQISVGGGAKETVRAITSSDGAPKLTALTGVSTASNAKGESATGTLPAGAEAVIHGHIGDSLVDQAPLGDSAVPINNKIANVTVSGDGKRVGVHEIEGGRVQFRMIRGSMTPSEQRMIKGNLNQAQDIYNPPSPVKP